MITLIGIVVIVVGLIVWVGQTLSFLAPDIATKLGNTLVVNTILLGALSAIPENPVKQEAFEKAISLRLKEKYVNLNLKAFQIGRKQVDLG